MATVTFNSVRDTAMVFFRKKASLEAESELIGASVQHLREDGSPAPSIEEGAAYVGRGCWILGEASFPSSVRIDGEVRGAITAQDCITIGATGLVTTATPIRAKTVIIAGTVRAPEVAASASIEIQASGRVWGNLTAPNLRIENGAFVKGYCLTSAADGADAYSPGVQVRFSLSGTEGLPWSLDDSFSAPILTATDTSQDPRKKGRLLRLDDQVRSKEGAKAS